MTALSGLTAERRRRSSALMLPVTAAPVTQVVRVWSSLSSASMRSTRSPKVRMILSLAGSTPAILTAPSLPVGMASRLSRAATWPMSIVYWARSSSASAKTNGSNSSVQNSARVQ